MALSWPFGSVRPTLDQAVHRCRQGTSGLYFGTIRLGDMTVERSLTYLTRREKEMKQCPQPQAITADTTWRHIQLKAYENC